MTKISNSTYGCSCPTVEKTTERALFAKTICNSYAEAVALLKGRNLGPGEIAVVRYYINDFASHWDETTGLPVRMVLGIGGANAQADDDLYIFNDDRIKSSSDPVTGDEVKDLISLSLMNYYAKSEIDRMLAPVINLDTIVTNRLKDMDDDIDELRGRVDKLSAGGNYVTYEYLNDQIVKLDSAIDEKADADKVYTKDEVNSLLDNIKVPEADLTNYYTKKEVDDLIANIDIPEFDASNLVTKEDLESVKDSINTDIAAIEDDLLTKADASIVEEISKDVDELSSSLDNKADASVIEEINTKLDAKVDASEVYTKTDVDNKVDNINNILDTKANASDVAEVNAKLDEKANTTDLDDLSTNVSNISAALDNKVDASVVDEKINLAVDAKIAEADIPGKVAEAIASSETITDAVNTAINDADIPGLVDAAIAEKDVVTTDKFDASMAEKADASVVENLSNLLNDKVDASVVYTKEEVYTKSEVENLINNIEIPEFDASNLVTKDEFEVEVNDINDIIDNKLDTSVINNYYNKSEVDAKIANIPTTDLSDYYTKGEVYTRFEVDDLIPDVTNYVTTETLKTEVESAVTESTTIKELQEQVNNIIVDSSKIDGGEEGGGEEW